MSNTEEIIQQVSNTQNKIKQSLTQQKDNLELLNDKLNKVADFAKNNYVNKDIINELANVSSMNNEMVDNINVSLNDILNHNAMNVSDESVSEDVAPSESMDTYVPELVRDDSSMETSENVDNSSDDSGYQSSIGAVSYNDDIDRQESDISEMSNLSENDLQNQSDIDAEMNEKMNANYEPSDAFSDVDGPDMKVYNADNTKADEEQDLMQENQGGKYRKTRRRRKNRSTKRRKGKSKKSRKYRRKTKRH